MKKTSIIIIVLVSLSGCKKIHCPEYPANLNYFPYYNGQELKFVNSQQNIHIFTIDNKDDSKDYSFEWNCKCECNAYSSFSTNKNQDSSYFKCLFNINGGRYGNIAYFVNVSCIYSYLHNYGNYVERVGECLEKALNIEKNMPYEEIYKYLEDTIVIENENSKGMKKIVIAKNKGLVSYTTADGEEWKLVE